MKRHGLCNRGLTALEDGQIKRSGSYLDAVELVAKVYQASLNCRKEKMYKKIAFDGIPVTIAEVGQVHQGDLDIAREYI